MTARSKGAKGATNAGDEATAGYNAALDGGKEGMETALRAGTEAANRAFAMSKDRMEAAVKGYDDLANFSKENMEALVASGNVTVKAIETLNAEALAFSRATVEDGVAATQAMLSAKTLKEVVDLQAEFAKTAFDSYLQQTTRFSEMSAKLTQEAFEPINARWQAAVEKFVKPVAV